MAPQFRRCGSYIDNLGASFYFHPRQSRSMKENHGYGSGQRIMQMSEDALRVEEGSLYPALYRIERQGWITAEWGVS
jgi:hypothetical protein